METEAQIAALETKLVQLQITIKRTDGVLAKADEENIARHQATLRAVTSEVDNLRLAVEAKKIAAKEDITEWNVDINNKLEQADGDVRATKRWLEESKRKQETIEREEKIQFEVKLLETKLKLQAEHETVTKSKSAEKTSGITIGAQAKLPKLVISKFEGTYMDWPRFWGQFTENIDKTTATPITKFAYLRELLDAKVRRTVEALPFTPEGYNRAKSILQDKYGKESEIVKAYTREILDLPTVYNANPKKIHDFSEKLMYNVQALETLKKLEQVNGAVSMTLDKLPGIRGDLVRTDPDWESWDFSKLTEALRQWTRRNPVDTKLVDREQETPFKRKNNHKLFHIRDREPKSRGCVYCDDSHHKGNECTKVSSTSERKQILAKRGLCFNCASGNHKASECASKASCQRCRKRHHTSICDSKETKSTEDSTEKRGHALTACEKREAVFPVVVIDVNGIRCRALVDSGAGSSYVSAKLIQLLGVKPSTIETRNIDMLMTSKVARFEVYDLEFKSVDQQFTLPVKATRVNKTELLSIENPNYGELLKKHPHLKGVSVNDDDTKALLPIHVVLGSGEYARIKTNTKPRIGKEAAPIAELTKFGWFLMSPGKEFDNKVMLLTQTTQIDYEELCRLDVLGLQDAPEHDQSVVFEEFKERLTRSPEGWYETTLPWKANHPDLPNNEQGSLKRLKMLTRKLQREGLTEQYDEIIQEQL